MTNTPFQLGSISSGTLRPEDLIPAFAAVLDPNSEPATRAKAYDPETTSAEEAERLLEDLENALSDMAPDYCYFGTTAGDGANFGFWLDDDVIREDLHFNDLLRVSDLSEVPDDRNGPVLLINDHGNMTLYAVVDGVTTEIWSVV